MKSRGNIHLFDRVECNGYLASRKPKWQLVISDSVNFKGWFHSTTWEDGKYHNEERLKCKAGDTSWMMRCREIEFDRGHEFRYGGVLNGFRFYCEECGKEKEHED